jgi:hypothetical protein
MADRARKPSISFLFPYLFPITILGGLLSRTQILGIRLVAVLQEGFSNLPENEAMMRFGSSAGLVGPGLFISELIRQSGNCDDARPRTRRSNQAT